MSNKTIVVTSNELRDHFKKYADDALENHSVIIVKRPHNKNMIMMSEDEYQSLQETEYLLRDPENRRFLEKSLDQLKHKETKTMSVDEWKEMQAIDNLQEEWGLFKNV